MSRLTPREIREHRQRLGLQLVKGGRGCQAQTPDEDPRSPHELYDAATALDESPDTAAEAEKLYRLALRKDPSYALARVNLGTLLFHRGDVAEAEDQYRMAIAFDPKEPTAYYNLGWLALQRGRALEAAEHFRDSIEHHPLFADAHFNLAMAYEEIGDWKAARRHWARYIEIAPDGQWVKLARTHLGSTPHLRIVKTSDAPKKRNRRKT